MDTKAFRVHGNSHANIPGGPDRPARRRHLAIAISAVLAGTLAVGLSPDLRAQTFTAVVPLSGLNGSDGFKLLGEAELRSSGFAVDTVGDISGDGIDDLIVSSPSAMLGASIYGGRSYVVFGRGPDDGNFAAVTALGDLDGGDGFRLDGSASLFEQSGWSVSGAGDLNGDGVDDLVIGAPQSAASGISSGSVYVVFGRNAAVQGGFPATVLLSGLDGSDGLRIDGEGGYSSFGHSVSRAGDINHDGIDDLLIGDRRASPNGQSSGAAYVLFGRNVGATGDFPATLAVSGLDGATGFRIEGVDMLDYSGNSVSDAGDINGDGIDDVLVGAYRADPNGVSYSGSAFVVFGRDTAVSGDFLPSLELATLDGTTGFRLNGTEHNDRAAYSVAGLGDINGDGFDDLIIGAPYADSTDINAGTGYVLFGRNTAQSGPFAAVLELAEIGNADGFRIDGEAIGHEAGHAVSPAGDVNGDGLTDLFISAPNADPDGTFNGGSSYVVFGHGSGFPTILNLGEIDGNNGFRIDGEDGVDYAGRAIGGGGDFNGDGFGDLIIGAPGAAASGSAYAGASYVVFGGVSGPGLIPAIAVDAGTLDFGDIALGATGPSTLQVDNPGTGALTVSSLSISGPQAAEFSITLDGCSGAPVDPGLFCTIDLGFSPTAAGVRSATLRIDSNAPSGPVLVTLRGSNDVIFADGFD